MKKDMILDLGLYFLKNTTSDKTKDNLNDFIVLVDILSLHHDYRCLTDSQYYFKNNKINISTLDDVLHDEQELNKVFLENEYSYDNFSIATMELLKDVIFIFDNDKIKLNDYLLKSRPDTIPEGSFSNEFYYCVLKQSKLPSIYIDEMVEEINYHQYIYKTFVL